LGDSEVLSVQDSVGPPIPELAQRPEEGAKVPSSIRRQDAGDVFPDNPTRRTAVGKSQKFESQIAALVRESAAESGDTERLAWRSSDEEINPNSNCCADAGEVAMVVDLGEPVR